ncbi:uncharacterized protein LOC123691358 [Colias croceus]|uniref:uncharacterized protein LOC123691358 n=1 Tax=Colias crocea TaxID=72248 RepID=UPI001E27BE30|nr:uncharacterized protein LOC123691358 [Colias croceus]
MPKCGGCGKFLSPSDAAKCDKCKGVYHRACVGLSTTGITPTLWQCPECKKNMARDNSSDTPVRRNDHVQNTSPSPNSTAGRDASVNFCLELKKIKDEILREVRSEFKTLHDELTEFRSSMLEYGCRIVALEERMTVLENMHTQTSSESASQSFNNIIKQLKSDINDRDQELLANDIEISNLPETSGENPIHTTILIASKIGIQIEPHDIVCAERIGARPAEGAAAAAPRPRRLVVRLARRQLRDDLLRSARVRRGATTADLDMTGPPRRFYINERLTKFNRQLFRMAREAGTSRGWRYVWSKRGRIFARNKPDDSVCFIRCEEDIQRIFGAA